MGRNIEVSHGPGMGAGVTSDLAQSPGSSGSDVVFGLIDESVFERTDSLGIDDSNSECLIEGSDVPECHDTRQPGITLGVSNIIDQSGLTTGV